MDHDHDRLGGGSDSTLLGRKTPKRIVEREGCDEWGVNSATGATDTTPNAELKKVVQRSEGWGSNFAAGVMDILDTQTKPI
jgi:hypothetical protein